MNSTVSEQPLLIELLTEELPSKSLRTLAEHFATTVSAELQKMQFLPNLVVLPGQDSPGQTSVQVFASPRRLGMLLPQVRAIQPPQQIKRKGPSIVTGLKDGRPSSALLGFARSCGVDISALSTFYNGNHDIYVYENVQPGQPLAAVLPDIVAQALKKLPAPKLMRWGDAKLQFVRPVHGLVMLHGSDVVPGTILGLTSGRSTKGHRFLSQGEITLTHAQDYECVMEKQGKVMADFNRRLQHIQISLQQQAERLQATICAPDALLAEVTALVEWPVILEAGFEAALLQVPQECLILTMQQHQKYFPLLDRQGKLMNRFLFVSNLQTADTSTIIVGNERVLRSRLSDARFFFTRDQKIRLEGYLQHLEQVVYHNKIGSQRERVTRLEHIATAMATPLGVDPVLTARAARLAKADLVTSMVGEFPELQGIMGRYYAQHDGEAPEVADAIAMHYAPRFAGDPLPQHPIAQAVALADKLETLVGIWGIGLIPTGDKDPFALRRAALGAMRILVHYALPLDLKTVLNWVAASFTPGLLSRTVVEDVYAFCLTRLDYYLVNENVEAGWDARVVTAILALKPTQFDQLYPWLCALHAFRNNPQIVALAVANKRVKNLLKKSADPTIDVKTELLVEHAEQDLFAVMQAAAPQVQDCLAQGLFEQALIQLAALREPVDMFFEKVLVMADEPSVRSNRLALLKVLARLLNQVADISLLVE